MADMDCNPTEICSAIFHSTSRISTLPDGVTPSRNTVDGLKICKKKQHFNESQGRVQSESNYKNSTSKLKQKYQNNLELKYSLTNCLLYFEIIRGQIFQYYF